jgi:transcriptional regulator GlxA family with amidase domain
MKFGSKGDMEDGLTAWVGQQAAKCERVVCVCSGALILAQAGLLSGHKNHNALEPW